MKKGLTTMIVACALMAFAGAASADTYEVVIGGASAQADAVKFGIARALCTAVPDRRSVLKKAGFLTRDAREVERKKYGKPGARKSFQFSKR